MAKALVARASNVKDGTILKYIRELTSLKEAKDTAGSEYQNALKRAKADGVKLDPLKAAIKAKKREPEDVTSELREYVRYLALVNIPTKQTDLFDGVAAEEDEATSEEADEHARWDAHKNGVDAGKAGHERSANPHGEGLELNQSWDHGWLEGQAEIAADMQPPPAARKANTRRARAAASAH